VTPGPVPRIGAVALVSGGFVVVMAALGGGYRLSVAVGAAILAIAAIGVDLCAGSAGLLVFSAPAFMLVGALSSALVARHAELAPTAETVLGVTVGLVAGALLAGAVSVALRRVQGIGVALVTLFVLQLVRSVARQQESLGGTLGLSGIPAFEIGPFRAVNPPGHAVVVMATLVIVAIAVALFVRSDRGLEVRAAAGDPTAAAASGIAVGRRRAEAFLVGSLCATVAGSLYAHVLGYVSAAAFGVAMLMDLLLMVFLGGAGSVWGVFVGAVAVGVIPDLVLGPTRFDVLARGVGLLAVLTVAPAGLAGLTRRFTGRGGVASTSPPGRAGASALPALPPLPPGEVIVEAAGLVHAFGAVRALDGVNVTLTSGEVCALIGPNGAGKTTLFNVLSGHLRPDAGRLTIGGVQIDRAAPSTCARLGVARTFQEVWLFPGLSVFEQVLVATRVSPEGGQGAAELAHQMLEFAGLQAVAALEADRLPFGAQRRVELARALARALARSPAVLLLDEPASGLSSRERADLADMLRRLSGGPAVVLVEHDVDFALSVATRTIVLEAGHIRFDGPTDAVVKAGVLDAYLGYAPGQAPRG
jgi:branched-chain amino acid transport system permease protein